MAIGLSFKNDIQYVKLSGTLSPVEEAAVRLKLDQKINQGRSKILIEVSAFALDNKDSIKSLQGVLRFAIQRGTSMGLFGIKQTLWIKIAENFPAKLNIFETEGEAIKWIEQSAQQKSEPTKVPTKPSPEDEIKQKLLAELLAKYEIYQAQNDYDPYLLRKLQDEYARSQIREPLFALRRAFKNIFTLKETLGQLDRTCRKLADELYSSMKIRKMPLSPIEIATKKKAIEDAKSAIQIEIGEIKKEVESHMAIAVDFRRKSTALQERWAKELDVLNQQIEQQNAENKKLMSLIGQSP